MCLNEFLNTTQASAHLVSYNHFDSAKVRTYVCMPPRPQITSGVILTLNDWLIIVATFQFHLMALAVDVIDRHARSNEIHHQLQPEKTKVRLY